MYAVCDETNEYVYLSHIITDHSSPLSSLLTFLLRHEGKQVSVMREGDFAHWALGKPGVPKEVRV